MLVRFTQNLGLLDIREVKDKTGCVLKSEECKAGNTVDVPAKAFEFLSAKYKALFEPLSVKGEAKFPEVAAPAKK